jgi:hypothetical protein
MSPVEEVHQRTQRKQEEGKPTQQVRTVFGEQEKGADCEEPVEHPGGAACEALASGLARLVFHHFPPIDEAARQVRNVSSCSSFQFGQYGTETMVAG